MEMACKVVPMKKIVKDVAEKEKLLNEVRLIKVLKHTNIIKFEGFHDDELNLYIMTEVCKNGTLAKLLE